MIKNFVKILKLIGDRLEVCVSVYPKLLMTIEPRGIFESHFAYLIVLTLFSHWYAKR